MKIQRFVQTLNTKKIFLLQLVLFFFLSNYLLSGYNCRLDVSRNGRFTLTSSTKMILNRLPDTLYMDAYYSSEIPPEYKARLELTKEMLREMANVNSDRVKLRFFDPDSDEKEKEKAMEAGIEPQTLQKVEMGSAQVKTAFLGVHLRLGKETESIPVVFFAEEAEYQILSTVKKMIRREQSVGSGVGILSEEGSMLAPRPGPGSGKDTFGVFMHQVFASEYGPAFPFTINDAPLPSDIQLLIVAGNPELSETGKYHLDQFIMNGGKLILLPKTMDFSLQDNGYGSGLAPGQKGFAQSIQNTTQWNEFFGHYGFQVGTDMVLEPNQSMPMGPLVQMEQGLYGRYHYPLWILASRESGTMSEDSPFTRDLEVLLMPWASSLVVHTEKQKEAKIETLIQSTKEAIVKENYLFIGEKDVYEIEEEPLGENIPLALHVSGKLHSYFSDKPQPANLDLSDYRDKTEDAHILVVSSPYIVSDILVARDFREIYQGANVPFLLNAIDILQGDGDLVASRSKKPAFEALQNISKNQELFYSVLNILVLPMGISIFAFFRLRRRNSGIGRILQ